MPRSGSVYWLEQALAVDPGRACPPLAGTVRADVCVVGGGYTGLWTAIELATQATDLRIAVVEASACGFGASGRNGGWMTSWLDELDRLVERFGEREGVWLGRESSRTIDRIAEFVAERGIACDLRRRGSLWAATAPGQEAIVAEAAAACRHYGFGDVVRDVSAEEVRELTGSPVARTAILIGDGAAVQPALLARGLRRAALELGVQVFEGSPMLRLERSRPGAVVTASGRVEADQVVIATNAWAARIRELRRAVFVVGTQMVLTEPVPDLLGRLPWVDGLLFGDARMFVHYAHVTPDRRIVFGRGGGAIGTRARVIPKHFLDDATAHTVASDFRRWFPGLAGVRLCQAWGGAVDRAPGHLPFVGALGEHGSIHYGIGYSGNGVGPSALVGRVLARRALGLDDEYTRCALVSGPPAYLPPEPLASAGAVVVRSLVQRSEEREEQGKTAGPVGRLSKRLASFSIPSRATPR